MTDCSLLCASLGAEDSLELSEPDEPRGCQLVLLVPVEDRVEAAALLLEVLCLCCQPVPGWDHEDCGAAESSDHESGQGGAHLVHHYAALAAGGIIADVVDDYTRGCLGLSLLRLHCERT